MTQIDTPVSDSAAADELIAEPDPGYRWKHLIMAVLITAAGGWFAYDGWVKWPAENVRIEQIVKDKEAAQTANRTTEIEALAGELAKLSHHTEADLLIQKILASVLPLFGIIWATWTIRDTRGMYRLAGDTLHVPGHPPISYAAIRRIDKRKWERKGVAFLHYEHGQPVTQGVLKLDDFAYDRDSTDQILDRIERNVIAVAR